MIGGVTVKLTDMFVPGYYANQDNGGQFGDRALEMMASDETWAYFNPNDAIGVHGMAKRLQELANSTGDACRKQARPGGKPPGAKWYKSNFKTELDAILWHYDKHGYPIGITEEEFVAVSNEWAEVVWQNREYLKRTGDWQSWDLMDGTKGAKISTPEDPDISGGIIKPYSDGALPVSTFWR